MKIILTIFILIAGVMSTIAQNNIPKELLDSYYSVRKSDDPQKKTQLASEMEQYMNKTILNENSSDPAFTVNHGNGSSSDWYNNDIMIHSGNLNELTSKPLILKQGEDGWLYMLAGLKSTPQNNGSLTLYKSSDGGYNWEYILNAVSGLQYFTSFDMLIESRDNSIADSTRIFVYYTASLSAGGNDAQLFMISTTRNGTGTYSGLVGTPASGRKFEQVTCCSDGQYYQSNTYIHAFVKESPNAGTTNGFRHFRSINWGTSHTNDIITTDPKDNYPCAQFFSTGASDSILIAFERIFDASSTGIGIYKTTELPTAINSYMMAAMLQAGVKNEKPCLTVSQQKFEIEKKMIITYTSAGKPASYHSTNNGKQWTYKGFTGTPSCSYTFCYSDSGSTAGNNFITGFVSLSGDSIMTSRTSAGGFYTLTKINNISSSPLYTPAFALLNTVNGRKSVCAFAGNSGINAYFDGEHFVTGIHNMSNEIPEQYNLEQNYPNPFNPVTNIKFSIPKQGYVSLKVFDITGKEISNLISGILNQGSYVFDFKASELPSGVYFYRLNAGSFTDVKKMILVK